MINRLVIAAAVLILFPIHPAFSLVYRESDDLFVYYPESEDRIATRLIEIFPSIRDFLEKQGIPLKYPLYVVLDNKLDRPGTDHCRLLAGAALDYLSVVTGGNVKDSGNNSSLNQLAIVYASETFPAFDLRSVVRHKPGLSTSIAAQFLR